MIIIAQQWLSVYFSHRGTEYKMRMNWATSNLIVLITLCGLVSTSAMAYDIKPPQRDGCPPSCGYGSHYYYDTNITNLGLIAYSWDNNAQYNLPLSSAQISSSADLVSYAVGENYEGWVAQGTNLIKDNEGLFLEPTINFAKLFAAMKGMGYAPNNETALQEWAETTSYDQRVAFVDEVVTNGVQGYIAQQTALMHKIAGELLKREQGNLFDALHQQHRPPIILDCAGLEAGAAIMGMYGAIVFLIPGGEAAAGIIALLVALYVFMFWASGCGNGNGNSPPPDGDRRRGEVKQ
jgi:hypothetical protein